jgi:uncharacterized protein YjbJ (UPF0337 family)
LHHAGCMNKNERDGKIDQAKGKIKQAGKAVKR